MNRPHNNNSQRPPLRLQSRPAQNQHGQNRHARGQRRAFVIETPSGYSELVDDDLAFAVQIQKDSEGEFVLIPIGIVPMFIGKAGVEIKKFQNMHKCTVQVRNHDQKFKKLRLSGGNVNKAANAADEWIKRNANHVNFASCEQIDAWIVTEIAASEQQGLGDIYLTLEQIGLVAVEFTEGSDVAQPVLIAHEQAADEEATDQQHSTDTVQQELNGYLVDPNTGIPYEQQDMACLGNSFPDSDPNGVPYDDQMGAGYYTFDPTGAQDDFACVCVMENFADEVDWDLFSSNTEYDNANPDTPSVTNEHTTDDYPVDPDPPECHGFLADPFTGIPWEQQDDKTQSIWIFVRFVFMLMFVPVRKLVTTLTNWLSEKYIFIGFVVIESANQLGSHLASFITMPAAVNLLALVLDSGTNTLVIPCVKQFLNQFKHCRIDILPNPANLAGVGGVRQGRRLIVHNFLFHNSKLFAVELKIPFVLIPEKWLIDLSYSWQWHKWPMLKRPNPFEHKYLEARYGDKGQSRLNIFRGHDELLRLDPRTHLKLDLSKIKNPPWESRYRKTSVGNLCLLEIEKSRSRSRLVSTIFVAFSLFVLFLLSGFNLEANVGPVFSKPVNRSPNVTDDQNSVYSFPEFSFPTDMTHDDFKSTLPDLDVSRRDFGQYTTTTDIPLQLLSLRAGTRNGVEFFSRHCLPINPHKRYGVHLLLQPPDFALSESESDSDDFELTDSEIGDSPDLVSSESEDDAASSADESSSDDEDEPVARKLVFVTTRSGLETATTQELQIRAAKHTDLDDDIRAAIRELEPDDNDIILMPKSPPVPQAKSTAPKPNLEAVRVSWPSDWDDLIAKLQKKSVISKLTDLNDIADKDVIVMSKPHKHTDSGPDRVAMDLLTLHFKQVCLERILIVIAKETRPDHNVPLYWRVAIPIPKKDKESIKSGLIEAIMVLDKLLLEPILRIKCDRESAAVALKPEMLREFGVRLAFGTGHAPVGLAEGAGVRCISIGIRKAIRHAFDDNTKRRMYSLAAIHVANKLNLDNLNDIKALNKPGFNGYKAAPDIPFGTMVTAAPKQLEVKHSADTKIHNASYRAIYVGMEDQHGENGIMKVIPIKGTDKEWEDWCQMHFEKRPPLLIDTSDVRLTTAIKATYTTGNRLFTPYYRDCNAVVDFDYVECKCCKRKHHVNSTTLTQIKERNGIVFCEHFRGRQCDITPKDEVVALKRGPWIKTIQESKYVNHDGTTKIKTVLPPAPRSKNKAKTKVVDKGRKRPRKVRMPRNIGNVSLDEIYPVYVTVDIRTKMNVEHGTALGFFPKRIDPRRIYKTYVEHADEDLTRLARYLRKHERTTGGFFGFELTMHRLLDSELMPNLLCVNTTRKSILESTFEQLRKEPITAMYMMERLHEIYANLEKPLHEHRPKRGLLDETKNVPETNVRISLRNDYDPDVADRPMSALETCSVSIPRHSGRKLRNAMKERTARQEGRLPF